MTQVIDLLVAVGLGVVSVALISAFGLQLMGEVQDDMTPDSAEANATGDGIDALAKIPGKLGIIVLAFIIVVVISVIKLIRG